jgi:outer membrane murein-binding lipoprotein Lpp
MGARRSLAASTAFAAILLAACIEDARVPKIEAKLEAKIAALEAANERLTDQINDLKFEARLADWDKFALLKPGDEGYSALRYDLGVVTVKIADVKPYANGSRISLQFGNLTSARIDGLKAKMEWGKVSAKGVPESDKNNSREVTFSAPLAPGAWTVSQVVLEGVPPTELGFVRLREVGHRGIGLRN